MTTVVVGGYWAYLISGRFADNHADYRVPDVVDPEQTAVFLRSAHEVLTTLLGGGRRVVLMLDHPNLDFSIQRCVLDGAAPSEGPSPRARCALDRQDFEARNAPYDDVMAQFARTHPGLVVFDPRSVLCDVRPATPR